MTTRTTVALVFGGESPEHGISCLTAASVLAAIDRDRYDVVGIGITPSGRWTQVPLDVIANYAVSDGEVPTVDENRPDAVWMRGAQGCQVATRDGDALVDPVSVDVAFALLHGPFGEDGTIQGLFEMMGIRYVGSGVSASANGMDKHLMKVMLTAAGLPVGPYVAFSHRRWRLAEDEVRAELSELAYPLFVKPARGGSSLGIRRVTSADDLADAIDSAAGFDPKIVVEQGFVGAREIECAVLADPSHPQGCVASVTGEVRVHTPDGFYDFEAKYIADDAASVKAPADLDVATSERVRDVAVDVFQAMGAEGLARVDVFVDEDDRVWVNEINTMPGFTKISMYPMLWLASGMSYPELVGRLIDLAMERPLGLR